MSSIYSVLTVTPGFSNSAPNISPARLVPRSGRLREGTRSCSSATSSTAARGSPLPTSRGSPGPGPTHGGPLPQAPSQTSAMGPRCIPLAPVHPCEAPNPFPHVALVVSQWVGLGGGEVHPRRPPRWTSWRPASTTCSALPGPRTLPTNVFAVAAPASRSPISLSSRSILTRVLVPSSHPIEAYTPACHKMPPIRFDSEPPLWARDPPPSSLPSSPPTTPRRAPPHPPDR